MKAGRLFYIGAVVTIVGLVLMSIPDRECVDCQDEETPVYKVTETEIEQETE